MRDDDDCLVEDCTDRAAELATRLLSGFVDIMSEHHAAPGAALIAAMALAHICGHELQRHGVDEAVIQDIGKIGCSMGKRAVDSGVQCAPVWPAGEAQA